MKKAIWGYDVKAVDDEIGKLEMQNYKLKQQIKRLESERREMDTRIRNISNILKVNRPNASTQDAANELRTRASVNVKELSREKLEQLLVYYAEGWKRSSKQVALLLAQISASRERTKDSLPQSANGLQYNYDGVGAAGTPVNASIVNLENHLSNHFLTLENPAAEAMQRSNDIPRNHAANP